MTMLSKNTPKLEHYQPKVIRDGSAYQLIITELCLISSENSLDKAYKKLEKQFSDIIQAYQKAGIINDLPQPEKFVASKNNRKLKTTILILASISFFFLFTAIASTSIIETKSGTTCHRRSYIAIVEHQIW